MSQKRSGRSSLASSVTHSRAIGSRVWNHCATDTVFPVAGPPVTSATRQLGLGKNLGQARTGNRPDRYGRAPELRAQNRKRAAFGDLTRACANHT